MLFKEEVHRHNGSCAKKKIPLPVNKSSFSLHQVGSQLTVVNELYQLLQSQHHLNIYRLLEYISHVTASGVLGVNKKNQYVTPQLFFRPQNLPTCVH